MYVQSNTVARSLYVYTPRLPQQPDNIQLGYSAFMAI